MIANMMDDFTNKFDILYSKRAFAYWFVGEGLESGEMSYCREEYACLINDYKEVVSDNREEN
jgi:tubulin alpha